MCTVFGKCVTRYTLTVLLMLWTQVKAEELEAELALEHEGATSHICALIQRAEDAEAAAAAAQRETMAVREEAADVAAAHAEATAAVESWCLAFQVPLWVRTHCRFVVRFAACQRR